MPLLQCAKPSQPLSCKANNVGQASKQQNRIRSRRRASFSRATLKTRGDARVQLASSQLLAAASSDAMRSSQQSQLEATPRLYAISVAQRRFHSYHVPCAGF